MNSPEKPLMGLIQAHYPDRDNRFYGDVLTLSRNAIGKVIDGLHKNPAAEPTPIFVDRVSFTWRLLRQADILVQKAKKSTCPERSNRSHVEAVLSTILAPLFPKLHAPLLAAIVEWLRLGPDGQYLYHYWCFRRPGVQSRLPQPFSSLTTKNDIQLLRTLIWWCLRARKEEYVEVAENNDVRVEYGFVVEEVLNDLEKWCGPEIVQFPNIGAEVEREFDRWLKYSQLDLSAEDAVLENSKIDPEFAKAFLKHNRLDIKLRIHRTSSDGPTDARVRELEAEIQRYTDEIRALEGRIQTLQSTSDLAAATPKCSAEASAETSLTEPDLTAFTELREVLKTIDSKYAFDTLNALQRGEETHLTFRSFAAHLLYALRKRGFSEYPNDQTFTLTYDASGLFECEGFEVPPGENVPVKVTRKGWAIRARGRWLPVRRARVSRTAVDPEV